MALRMPPIQSISTVTLPVARSHICELEPSLSWHDVGTALLEAIGRKDLPVYDVPDFPYSQKWMDSPSVNWATGDSTVFRSGCYGLLYDHFTPMVELAQAVALFEEQPEQPERSEPVAAAALSDFVHATMKAEPMVEAAVRVRAGQHFAPRQFTDSQWREAWRNAPGKLGRGKKPPVKSGA